jgi:hypothetical protein
VVYGHGRRGNAGAGTYDDRADRAGRAGGPDDYPSHPDLQKWAHEEDSAYIGSQKVKVTSPRPRDVVQGEVPLKSYAQLHTTGDFSEELLELILRDVSAQQDTETVIDSARAFGVSLTTQNLKAVPGAVPGSVHAVCDRSGHHPPGRLRRFSSPWAWT